MWPAVGALIAGGASLIGGERANKGRAREARRQRQFNAAEAVKQRVFSAGQAGTQRSFQERMRNTSWQAGIADMEAAGLNPALAYSQGGASAPMGAMGSSGAASGVAAGVEDVITPAISSAMQVRRVKQELSYMKQQEDTALASRYKMDQEAMESRAREKNLDETRAGIKWQNILLGLQVPGAKNIAGFEGGSMGKGTRTIRSLLQSVFGSGGAFKAR